MPMGIDIYRGRGSPRGMGKGGEKLRYLLLCGKWLDIINPQVFALGDLRHPYKGVCQGGASDKCRRYGRV